MCQSFAAMQWSGVVLPVNRERSNTRELHCQCHVFIYSSGHKRLSTMVGLFIADTQLADD